MRPHRRWALAALLVFSAACTDPDISGKVFICYSDIDCGDGWRCERDEDPDSGICVPVDAYAPDSGDLSTYDSVFGVDVAPADAIGGDVAADVLVLPDVVVADVLPDVLVLPDIVGDDVAAADAADAPADASADVIADVAGTGCPDAGCPDDDLPCTEPVCTPERTCDLVLAADTCLIDGRCVEAGTLGGPCALCDPDDEPYDWTTADFGAPCGDGDACTDGASCSGLDCTGGAAVDCDDGDPCTADSCDAATGCAHTPNTDACDDGDACTTVDACADGACKGGAPLGCDDGSPCTVDGCDSATGCTAEPQDGACDDGDACTTGEACAEGACAGGTAVECDDGDACTTDSCDQAEGCVTSAAPPCEAADACTTAACDPDQGCTSEPLSCDDQDACTADSCDPTDGCLHAPISCDDGDACTSDGCDAASGCGHEPVPCDDGDACTTDGCDAETGCAFVDVGDSCDDGDACTADSCDTATGCVAGPVSCDDGDACTADSCDTATGCGHAAISCDDGEPCTTDGCDPATGCAHTDVTAPCDDGDACTSGDACEGGSCKGGPAIACDDEDVCTDDACSPATGCTFSPNAALCDDGDACTAGEACAELACTGGVPVDCSDGNQCTSEECLGASGCTYADVSATCDDGDACTDDGCDTATGCAATPMPALSPCDDGSACTTGDVCSGGACVAPPGPPAFDGVGVLNTSAGTDGGENDTNVVLATDGTAVMAVWQSSAPVQSSGTDHDVLYAVSTNGGLSFGPTALLNTTGTYDGTAADTSPHVASDGAGGFLAVWSSTYDLVGAGSDTDIFYARWDSGASSWTNPKLLTGYAVGDAGNDLYPVVASTGAGQWMVIWTTTSDLAGGAGDEDLVIARSFDGGQSFSAPEHLNPVAATGNGSDRLTSKGIATDGKGGFMVAFASNDALATKDSEWDILVTRSWDQGATWSEPTLVTANQAADPGDSEAPRIATDGAGRWVVVFESKCAFGTGAGADVDILYSRSVNGGQSWSSPKLLPHYGDSDGANVEAAPTIATDGLGAWVAAWTSAFNLDGTAGIDEDILYATSTDGGQSWSPAQAISPQASIDGSAKDRNAALCTVGVGTWLASWESYYNQGGSIGGDPDLFVSRAAAPPVCDDLDPCTTDSCDPIAGCINDPIPECTP